MESPIQITLVVGARPNFMKAAPLMRVMEKRNRFQPKLIHTGQHFDEKMSTIFFEQLELPEPDTYLGIHGGTPADQIGRTILALNDIFNSQRPDAVVVFGDVNSTLAAAVSANKLEIYLAHVEAGLRSNDRSMPEEHNRILTDMLADVLFTPSQDANDNLRKEGVPNKRIECVGNIMVDSLLHFRDRAKEKREWEEFGLSKGAYGIVTLHRPGNVDEEGNLNELVNALVEIQKTTSLLFPAHPRTFQNLQRYGLFQKLNEAGVKLLEPLGYLEFLNLLMNAKFVLTDSGGVQEETTILGVPCLTARDNTERPITIEMGTNRLVGTKTQGIVEGFKTIDQTRPPSRAPELWDGQTAERIEAELAKRLGAT